MKTLKKTLCLVLAVVMAVGVLVIPANAVDFDDLTDKDEIKHAEAVMVLNGMGILTGKDDGSFDPTGTLSRNQAAKIVAYAHGGAALAESYGKTETLFNDVPANGYYTGFINYVAMNGLVGGDGAGNFMPTKSLTGYQLGKMMLLAAGIGVEADYSGTGWTMKVNNALVKANLLANLADIDLSKAITRDDAAQLLFNVMQYAPNGTSVEYVVYNDTYPVNADKTVGDKMYTQGQDEFIWSGTDEITALLMKASNEGSRMTTATTNVGSLADVNYGLKSGTDADDFGREYKIWYNKNNTNVVYASLAPSYQKSYTAATKYSTILSDLGFKTTDEVTVKLIDNGTPTTYEKMSRAALLGTTGYVVNGSKLSNDIGGYGVLIEAYKDNKTVTLIKIDTYAVKLADENIVKAKAATATTEASPAYVTVDGKVIVTDAFKKGDVVLYTANEDEIVNMVVAPATVGVVTAQGNGYLRINNEVKYLSAHSGATLGTTEGFKFDSAKPEFTYYFDDYGNIIMAVKGQTQEVKKDYVYVLQVKSQAAGGNTTGGNLFEEIPGNAARAQAMVIDLAQGTRKIVDLAVVQNAAKTGYFYADQTGAASSTPVEATNSFVGNSYYTFTTLENGSIVLVDRVASLEKVVISDTQKVQIVDGKTYVANSSTVLNILTYNAQTGAVNVTTSTGYTNFSNATYTDALVEVDSNGIITKITVVKAPDAVVTSTTYAIYIGPGEISDVTAYSFFVGGEVKNVTDKDGKVYGVGDKATTEVTLKANSVYDISESDGQLTATELIGSNITVKLVQAEYVVGADDVVTFFADNCAIYDAANDYAALKVADLEADDVLTVFKNASGRIEFALVNVG